MKNSYTHICVVLDRSGSMESIREDTIGGFNAFVEQQKKASGTATLTLVQFDTQNPFEVVHSFTPIADVPGLTRDTFVPRASTPLFDAIGQTINHTEQGIAQMTDFCRPDTVIIAVITDGQENSSREFRHADILRMIEAKQKLLNWKYVFLSADLGAVQQAVQTGIAPQHTMGFAANSHGVNQAWNTLSDKLTDVRAGQSQDIDFREPPKSKGKAKSKTTSTK